MVAPIAAKLYKTVDDLFGPDFRDNWFAKLQCTYIHTYTVHTYRYIHTYMRTFIHVYFYVHIWILNKLVFFEV